MKTIFTVLIILFLILPTSCITRVVSPQKPMYDNSLELYHRYTVQTNDGRTQKLDVLKVDSNMIYGKNNRGEDVTINRNQVRQISKFNWLPSIGIAVAAILAVVFVPI